MNLTTNLIERVLDEWESWPLELTHRPTLCRQTEHRPSRVSSNTVYCLHVQGRERFSRLAVRLSKRSTEPLISRLHEKSIHCLAASHQISPTWLHDAQTQHNNYLCNYSLVRWLDAKPKTQLSETEIAELISVIGQYQNLDIASLNLPVYSYTQALDRYALSTDPNDALLQANIANTAALLKIFEKDYGNRRCLTHNDLNPGNIIWSSNSSSSACWIIDWEFAGLGIPSFDLASLAAEFKLSPECISVLANVNREEIELAIQCYKSLCEIYNKAAITGNA